MHCHLDKSPAIPAAVRLAVGLALADGALIPRCNRCVSGGVDERAVVGRILSGGDLEPVELARDKDLGRGGGGQRTLGVLERAHSRRVRAAILSQSSSLVKKTSQRWAGPG